jgi:hypothetical protein
MSFIHEIGHCLSVLINGGVVNDIVWRYGIFSETLRSESTRPVMDIWAGPIVGCIVPLMTWAVFMKLNLAQYLQWFASMCLIGNGLYLALGWMDLGSDSHDLILNDVSLISIIGLGLSAFVLGLFLLFWDKPSANQSLHGSGQR